MTFSQLFIAPFADYEFMRRALVACILLAVSGAPIGILLMARRMSLIGDSLSHAVLPGAALGYILMGLSFPAMSIGGFITGLLLALIAGLITRLNILREDASFAALFPISLAIGVTLMSTQAGAIDIMHILFGNLLGVDQTGLVLAMGTLVVTLSTLAIFYRPLLIEAFDPLFARMNNMHSGFMHYLFLALTVLNMVAGFQILGTLMALGLMMVPAAAAHFWVRHLAGLALLAALFAVFSVVFGLLLSFHCDLPSGPAIVLTAGTVYLLSLLVGRHGSVYRYFIPLPHLKH